MIYIEKELDDLKKEVLEMWDLVNSQLNRAGEALLSMDKELAHEVTYREKRVNAFELKIDSDCEDIIGLYNPVALDLRFTLAMMKTSNNLERIAAFCAGDVDSGFLQNLTLYGIGSVLSGTDTAAGNFPPAGRPLFVQFPACNQILAVRTLQYTQYGQVKLVWFHMPVVPVHSATGFLLVFIVNIPLFHGFCSLFSIFAFLL